METDRSKLMHSVMILILLISTVVFAETNSIRPQVAGLHQGYLDKVSEYKNHIDKMKVRLNRNKTVLSHPLPWDHAGFSPPKDISQWISQFDASKQETTAIIERIMDEFNEGPETYFDPRMPLIRQIMKITYLYWEAVLQGFEFEVLTSIVATYVTKRQAMGLELDAKLIRHGNDCATGKIKEEQICSIENQLYESYRLNHTALFQAFIVSYQSAFQGLYKKEAEQIDYLESLVELAKKETLLLSGGIENLKNDISYYLIDAKNIYLQFIMDVYFNELGGVYELGESYCIEKIETRQVYSYRKTGELMTAIARDTIVADISLIEKNMSDRVWKNLGKPQQKEMLNAIKHMADSGIKLEKAEKMLSKNILLEQKKAFVQMSLAMFDMSHSLYSTTKVYDDLNGFQSQLIALMTDESGMIEELGDFIEADNCKATIIKVLSYVGTALRIERLITDVVKKKWKDDPANFYANRLEDYLGLFNYSSTKFLQTRIAQIPLSITRRMVESTGEGYTMAADTMNALQEVIDGNPSEESLAKLNNSRKAADKYIKKLATSIIPSPIIKLAKGIENVTDTISEFGSSVKDTISGVIDFFKVSDNGVQDNNTDDQDKIDDVSLQ
jgi:hypothetical protein